MNKFVGKWKQMSLDHVAEGGTLAEEVILTIRTAQAFGSQKTLGALYHSHILKAQVVEMRVTLVHGSGIGIIFFIVYCAYALAFYFGTTLIIDGNANVGAVVNVFMAILIGSFALVQLAPEMQAITQGKGAAAKLYATIDRVPVIDSLSKEGNKIQAEKVHGEIEFKDIAFNYPSRSGVPIFKLLSLRFPAGKSTALVGASGSGKSTIISLVERFYDPLAGTVHLDGFVRHHHLWKCCSRFDWEPIREDE
jgi:ATP-binding cassette subfamily B (MDR/TAP) protein 1